MRRTLLLAGIAVLAACGSEADEGEPDIVCWLGMEQACAPAVEAAAHADLEALQRRVGALHLDHVPDGDGVIIALDAESITLRLDDGFHVFGWPGPLPAGFAIAETVRFEQIYGWQSLRSETFGLAIHSVEEYAPSLRAGPPPGGGPALLYEPSCQTSRGTAIALGIDWFGEERMVHPGESATVGAWTIANHGGLALPTGSDGDPGAWEGGGCVERSAMAAPVLFRLVATAEWRPDEAVQWCDRAAYDDARTFLDEGIGGYGIRFEGAPATETTSGTIEQLGHDEIVVALADRGTARFRWPEPIPAGLEVGESVEIAAPSHGWHMLQGSIRLALWANQDFVYPDALPPLFGTLDLALVPGCAFPDTGAGMTCGQPAGRGELLALELPDGSLLPSGGRTQVGATVVALHGAVQLPSYGSDGCVVDAWFTGLVTAVAPAP